MQVTLNCTRPTFWGKEEKSQVETKNSTEAKVAPETSQAQSASANVTAAQTKETAPVLKPQPTQDEFVKKPVECKNCK